MCITLVESRDGSPLHRGKWTTSREKSDLIIITNIRNINAMLEIHCMILSRIYSSFRYKKETGRSKEMDE